MNWFITYSCKILEILKVFIMNVSEEKSLFPRISFIYSE